MLLQICLICIFTDKNELPDLKMLQDSLLDIGNQGHVYVTLMDQLLHFSREDPAFVNHKEVSVPKTTDIWILYKDD